MYPRSIARGGTVTVALVAAALLIGGGAASARPSDPPPLGERHEQSVQVIAAHADSSIWQGGVSVSRSTRPGQPGQRPWQVSMAVERTVCDVGGCIRTVLSTPSGSDVLVSAHLGAKLSAARVRRAMIPVVVERFEGVERVSRQVTVMGLTVRASAVGSITTDSVIRIEGTRHQAIRHRWVVANAAAVLTPMVNIAQTVEPIEIGSAKGRISVVRETVTNIGRR